MGEIGKKGWLDDLYGKLLRLHLHYIWPRRKPHGLIARAWGKSLPSPAHGLEPAAQTITTTADSGEDAELLYPRLPSSRQNPSNCLSLHLGRKRRLYMRARPCLPPCHLPCHLGSAQLNLSATSV